MNVWTYLYRVTGSPSTLHFLTWSLSAKLCHTTPGSSEQCGECRTQPDWLFNEPLDSLNPQPPLHGLALTSFLDCNTRHVECSTCCVPRLGIHNPTKTITTATTTVTHAEVLNGNDNTDTNRIKETNQEKYLIIYLNSLILNLCLYTVNSAMLQRNTSKQMLRNFERC